MNARSSQKVSIGRMATKWQQTIPFSRYA